MVQSLLMGSRKRHIAIIIGIFLLFFFQYNYFFSQTSTPANSPEEPFYESDKSNGNSNSFANHEKKSEVKMAFAHAWYNYVIEAWGKDEVKPVSGGGMSQLNMAWTMIDSLDTLYIMGFKDEFERSRNWIEHNLDFKKGGSFSAFETNIRVLGGLLSAYGLSGDEIFKKKAIELGDILILAFDTPSGFPDKTISFSDGNHWSNPCLAEIGTYQLEFVYLSQISGNATYARTALKIFDKVDSMGFEDGLIPTGVDTSSGSISGTFSIGGCGDSYFEYLLKTYFFTQDKKYLDYYHKTLKGLKKLVRHSKQSNLAYIVEKNPYSENHRMEHLACFVGGMFSMLDESLELGKEITRTCYEMYHRAKTGISSESVRFDSSENDFFHEGGYILRPETVESFFYLWRKTHDPKYREWGWQVFQAINKYCRAPHGFSGIDNVNQVPPHQNNRMESFFLAETLKYLYLLFEDDNMISLNDYVFNTEAHPFPISTTKYL